jgi:hypothetical protein
VKELAGSYPSVSFLSVEGEIDQLWQAGVEIDVYLGRIEGDCKFESAFRVPLDEVLFFMRTCLLVVDDGVGVPSDFTQQVKNFSGDIFPVKMFVVIIRLEHLLKLELFLSLLFVASLTLRVNLQVFREFREDLLVQFDSDIHGHLIEPLFEPCDRIHSERRGLRESHMQSL